VTHFRRRSLPINIRIARHNSPKAQPIGGSRRRARVSIAAVKSAQLKSGCMKASLSVVFALLLACSTASAQSRPQLHVIVALAHSVATVGVSGRLLIFMSNKPDSPLRPTWGSDPQDLWMAAKEVANLAPGDSVDLDADDLAFPEPFSKAPPGK
jgi:hypothetical protein